MESPSPVLPDNSQKFLCQYQSDLTISSDQQEQFAIFKNNFQQSHRSSNLSELPQIDEHQLEYRQFTSQDEVHIIGQLSEQIARMNDEIISYKQQLDFFKSNYLDLSSVQMAKEDHNEKYNETIKTHSQMNNLYKQIEDLKKELLMTRKQFQQELDNAQHKSFNEIESQKRKIETLIEENHKLVNLYDKAQEENFKHKDQHLEFEKVNNDLMEIIKKLESDLKQKESKGNEQTDVLIKSFETMQQKYEEQLQKSNKLSAKLKEAVDECELWRKKLVQVERNSEMQHIENQSKIQQTIQELEFQNKCLENLKLERNNLYTKLQDSLQKYQQSFEEVKALEIERTKLQKEITKYQSGDDKLNQLKRQLNQQADVYNKQLLAQKQQIDQLTNEKNEFNKKFQSMKDKLQNEISQLVQQLTEKSRKYERIKQRVLAERMSQKENLFEPCGREKTLQDYQSTNKYSSTDSHRTMDFFTERNHSILQRCRKIAELD